MLRWQRTTDNRDTRSGYASQNKRPNIARTQQPFKLSARKRAEPVLGDHRLVFRRPQRRMNLHTIAAWRNKTGVAQLPEQLVARIDFRKARPKRHVHVDSEQVQSPRFMQQSPGRIDCSCRGIARNEVVEHEIVKSISSTAEVAGSIEPVAGISRGPVCLIWRFRCVTFIA
jgi:hypothetical protein